MPVDSDTVEGGATLEEVFDVDGVPYPSRNEWEKRFAELEARMGTELESKVSKLQQANGAELESRISKLQQANDAELESRISKLQQANDAELESRISKLQQNSKPSPLLEVSLKSLENRRELQKLESESMNHRMDKTGDRLSKLEDDFQNRHTLSENYEVSVMERIQASVAKVAEDMGLSHESLDSRIERKLQVFMRDLETKTDRIENTLRLRTNELEAGLKSEEATREAAVGRLTNKLVVHDDTLRDHQRQLDENMRHLEERCQQEHAYTDATKEELLLRINSLGKQVQQCQEEGKSLQDKMAEMVAQVEEQMKRMEGQMKEMKKMGDGLKNLEERVEFALASAAEKTAKGFAAVREEMAASNRSLRAALNKLEEQTREGVETLRMEGEEAAERGRSDLRSVRDDLLRSLLDTQKNFEDLMARALQSLEASKANGLAEMAALQQALRDELFARLADLQAELDRRSIQLRGDLSVLNDRFERDFGAAAARLEDHSIQLDNRLTLKDAEQRFGAVGRQLGVHDSTLDAAEQMLNDHEKILRKIMQTLGTFPTLDSPNRPSRRLSARVGSPEQADAVRRAAIKAAGKEFGVAVPKSVVPKSGGSAKLEAARGETADGKRQVTLGTLVIERGENLSDEALDAAILAEQEVEGVEVPLAEEPYQEPHGRQLVSKLVLGNDRMLDYSDDESDAGFAKQPTSVAESLAMLTEQAELHEMELQRLDAQINAVLNELVDKYGVKAMRLMLKLHAKDVKEAYYVFETKVVRGEVAYGKIGCFVPGGMSVDLVAEKAQLSAQLIAKLVDFSYIAHCLGPNEQRGGYYMVRTPEQRRAEEVDEFVNVLVLGALPPLPSEGSSSKIMAAGAARKGFEEQLRRALALALSKYAPVRDDGTLFSKKQLLPACVACNRPLHSGAAAALFMDKDKERGGAQDDGAPPNGGNNGNRWDDGFDESVASSDAGDYGAWDHGGGGDAGGEGMFPYDDAGEDDLEVYKRFRHQKKREGKQQLLHAMGRTERRYMYGAMGTGELRALQQDDFAQQAAAAAKGPGFVTVGGFKMPKKTPAPARSTASRSDPAFAGSAANAAMDQTHRMRPTAQVQLERQPQLARGRPQSAHSSRKEPMRGRVRPQSAARHDLNGTAPV
jgi:hypothetical protein